MKMTVRVIDVIDGAWFRVSSGATVRLRNVVAPSLLTLAGQQAKSRLEELVLHKHVECEEVDSDNDGNIIARVWVDGLDVNQILCGPVRPAQLQAPGAVKKVEIQIDESAFKPQTASDKPPAANDKQ
jgi:hypothetical protein